MTKSIGSIVNDEQGRAVGVLGDAAPEVEKQKTEHRPEQGTDQAHHGALHQEQPQHLSLGLPHRPQDADFPRLLNDGHDEDAGDPERRRSGRRRIG